MSDEEFDRKMEFIIDQQAQFAADIGQLKDIVARLADFTLRGFEASEKRFAEVDEKIAALVDSQIRADEQHRELRESVMRTSEDVRNLAAVVDQYFRNRNGKSEG